MVAAVSLDRVRNIGIAAHIDAGKTTATEYMLFRTGRIHRVGSVDEGTTVTDWMDQEMERGITITSAATACEWNKHLINIIDTPGHVDFTVEVERSLRVLDGCIAIFCAASGVQPQSETIWRQANWYHIPRIAFVNKMDRMGAHFHDVLHQMRARLEANVLAVQLPIGSHSSFHGMVDLVERKALTYDGHIGSLPTVEPVPEDMVDLVETFRDHMVATLAEHDEVLETKYLEGQEPTCEELRAVLRRATLEGTLVPVLCGSALRGMGIEPLLDAIVNYLPSPIDIPPVVGRHPEKNTEETRHADPKEPLCALLFKVMTDPFTGRLSYIRIYSGVLKKGQTVLNPRLGKRERCSRLLRMHANRREDVDEAGPGSIVAVVGLNSSTTGDTLCDQKYPIVLERMSFPEPVISMAIEPRTKADEEQLLKALQRLGDEDPTFASRVDPETGQQIISGMGELHLEIIKDRLLREFKVDARVGAPQVAYKETITKVAEGRGECIRQTGGHGQYGVVVLRIEPAPDEVGFEFIDETHGDAIPSEFKPAIRQGIQEAMTSGVLGGYPVDNVRVYLVDGKAHEVDSSDLAFRIAASEAFRRAAERAEPMLLEPIMEIEVVSPESSIGDVTNDLAGRRARVVSSTPGPGGTQIIRALAPLRNLFQYSTALRDQTQGRGTYTMQPHSYEPVPPEIQKEMTGR
ncbi:MAG: elongation factor G [Candidatus Zipacnadales bacterium]